MKKYFILFIMSVLMGAGTSAQKTEAKNIFTYKTGSFEVDLLSEGQQKGNAGILIGATSEMLQECVPDGTFPNATNAFLVRMSGKNILVDTGLGRELFKNLQSLGVTENDIDVILITHMHGDHIGGLLKNGEATFPQAEIYLPQPEYTYWMSDDEMNRLPDNRRGGFLSARNVANVYKNKLHLFQPEMLGDLSSPVLPGIYAFAAYGHTPGHTAYLLKSGEDEILIWGDLTHAMAIQMSYPGVAVTYDVNPEDAIDSRRKVLEYVTANDILIAGMHIAYPAIGKVEKKNFGYQFLTVLKKSSL